MYQNIRRSSLKETYRLYRGKPGSKVVRVFEENGSLGKTDIIGKMEAKINELGLKKCNPSRRFVPQRY
jgi:hypothetical protein